jgi:two-component sensor histidine kinase
MDLTPIEVETRAAIPCGLILNELMTNSLKHAFPAGGSGEIRVALRREGPGAIRLQVSDTGAGLPGDFGARPRTSLGLTLVSDLARQLSGSLDITGAAFTVTFPSPPG